MSNARVIRRPAPARKTTSESSSSGKGKWIAAVLLLLLLAGVGYALMPARRDPGLARIDDLRSQMEGATPEQRRELWGEMRQEMENLSPEARETMREEWRDRQEQREQQFYNDFFALSPQEQTKKLDESLREETRRRKEREQRAAAGTGNRGNRGPGGPGAGGGGRGGFGGGRGERGGERVRNSSDDPNARRRSYLDKSTPQQRAQRSEYRQMREERRKQLGL